MPEIVTKCAIFSFEMDMPGIFSCVHDMNILMLLAVLGWSILFYPMKI